MSSHLYAIGQNVSLDGQERLYSKLNPFTVEAQLPPVGDVLQYRVKSTSEYCRRVVREDHLSPDTPQDVHLTLTLAPVA